MDEYLTLLRRNPNFRNLWLGSVVSQLGDWFNVIAAAAIISRVTDSGAALSFLFVSRFLPLFLLSPVAGVLADRFDRRRILILSDLLRGVTVLGFLLIRDAGDIPLFYLLTVIQFSLSALFTPARGAVVANIVPAGELVAANALDSLTWSTMLALGAFLGGVVAALFGAETAFVADALSFLLSAYFISRVVVGRAAGQPAARAAESAPAGRFAFLDGFRYLWREPFILGIALAKAGGSLVWGAINVLEIRYAYDLFPLPGAGRLGIADAGTATLGLIYVVAGVGTGVGPLLMRRWLGDAPRRLVAGVSLGYVAMTVGTAWLATVGGVGGLLLATVVRTLGTGTLWVFSSALLQTIVPDRYRGRVFSFEFAALTLTQSISTLAAGAMIDRGGLAVAGVMGVQAAVSLATTALWALFHLRHRAILRSGGLPLRAAAGPSAVPQLPE
ncbi:MAG: MFS transporter [Candidatus Promineofilum sp.]|nr:MFS transporter [Promineifilum sp.]MCW5864463.1 MFS transporter [Anaerolineae bacterium]